MVKKILLFTFILLSVKLFAQAPVLSNFRIDDSQKSRIYFDSSEPIVGTISTGFYLSDNLRKKVTGITIIAGATNGHYFTASAAFDYWDTYAIRYEGGSDIKDNDGNPLYEFWLTEVVNQISEPAPSGTLYWVRTTGSDTNDGLSHATAFKTINKAISLNAQTIYVEAGDYGAENLNFRYNGTATNPIILQGYKTQTNGVPDEITSNYWEWGSYGTGMNASLDTSEFPTLTGNATIRNTTGAGGTAIRPANFLIVKNFQSEWWNKGFNVTGKNHVVIKNFVNLFSGHTGNSVGGAIYAVGGIGPGGTGVPVNIYNKYINVTTAQGIAIVRIYGGGSLMDNVKVYGDGASRTPDYFISIYEGSNMVTKNCYVEKIHSTAPGSHGMGVKTWDFVSEYNLWQDCTAVYMTSGLELRHDRAKNNVVRNFTAYAKPGSDYKGGTTNGIVIRDNASANKIENSTFHDVFRGIYFTDQSGEQGYQTPGFDNSFRNIVIYNADYVFGTYGTATQPLTYGNTFDNFTIDSCDKMFWASGSLQFNNTNFLTNSTISNCTNAYTGATSITQNNNNYYNNNFQTPSGTNITTYDPQFIDVNNRDYHLQLTSPIKNIGINLSRNSYDMGGVERINGTYSIGAYEDETPSLGSVSSGSTICIGESVTLVASGGTSYLWNTGETTASITVNPSTTTTYSVTISDGTNSDSHDVVVTVNEVPVVDLGADQSICFGETVTLTATGVGNFLWNTGETTGSITVNPTTTTTYSVTASTSCATDATDEIIINVNAEIGLTVGNDISICVGESTTLTAASNGDFLWSTGETTPSITVQPNSTTTYTVTSSLGNCTENASILVTVNVPPSVDLGADQSICYGETVTLTATGVGNFLWSTGETTPSITVQPNSTTTYTVIASNACSDTVTDDVVINVNPEIGLIIGNDISICTGESTTLTASGNGDFLWSTGETTPTITVQPTTTTTYTVTSSLGNCTENASVIVTISDSSSVDLGPDQSICFGQTVTLTATGTGNYLWNTGETTSSITVNPTTTTTYSVIASNSCSADATDDIIVTVNELPSVNAGDDITILNGENTTLTATGAGSFLWNTGETSASITVNPTSTTTYSVVLTSDQGCLNEDTVMVIVENTESVADAGQDQNVCPGSSETVLTASGGDTYLWSTGETTASITVSPTVTTVYTVAAYVGNTHTIDEVTVFIDESCSNNISPEQQEFKIFPNPTNGLVNIEMTGFNGDLNVTLYNLNGSMVHTENMNNSSKENVLKSQINLSRLAKGMYFVRLNNGSQVVIKKLIVI
jgi:hypothetical protein